MTTHQRRHFSPEQEMAILRRHLLEHVPVSDLCDEYGLQDRLLRLAEAALRERHGCV